MTEIVQYLGFDVNGGEVERLLGDRFETHIPSANEVKYRIDGREVTVSVGDWVYAEGWLVPGFTRTAMEHASKRLGSMRAQLEVVAQDVSDGAYHTDRTGGQFQHEQLSDLIREIARG